MITRNTILFLTCIVFVALAGVSQATVDVNAEWIVVEKLAAGAGMGPEDIAFDAEGRMYASMEGGIMRFQPDGSQPEVFARTPARPLGLRFDADGNLIVCDGQLFSVAPDGTVTMLSDDAEGGPITTANGLDIAKNGTIYFTDTTSIPWAEEFADPGPRGSLLAYDPATSTTSLVLGDLWFANGVAISLDQSFVLIAEGFANRVTRYWLTGPRQGESEVFVEGVVSDNLSTNPRGMFWISSYYEGVLLEADTDGNVVRRLNLLHPSGEPYTGFTGAREREGTLYLSNNQDDAIGRILPFAAPRAEDFTNVFFMSLERGLNMISIPLKPAIQYTARSLAEKLSATVIIKYDTELGRFVGFTPNASGDGFSIEGGEGYIVNVPEVGVFPFVGAAWTNELSVAAAPPAQTSNAWAFVVSGSVDGISASNDSYTAIVKNARTGDTFTESVDSRGYFITAWADLSRKAVIRAGDQVEVAVTNSSGEMVSGPFIHDIKLDEIRNAVANLHMHLDDIISAKPALLQNYPNPFNPETWIPFQLSKEADVNIRIFNASGKLVRTLSLGRKEPGLYVDRDRAVHWDGKNEVGEEITSGIYFYTITAGEFSATRKMIVKK